MESVLVLRPDQAGDALKSLPALRRLRELRPDLELHILVSEANASILETEPGWQSHRVPTGWRRASPGELAERLAATFEGRGFDSAVSLLCDPSEGMDRLLRAVPARKKFAASVEGEGIVPLTLPPRGPSGNDETHNIARLLSLALGVDLVSGLDSADGKPRLLPSDGTEAEQALGAKKGAWLGFCPFSTIKKRNLPLKRWEALVRTAAERDEFERLIFFGLPEHREIMERLRAAAPGKGAIAYPSSIRALGAYLLRLDGVVAVDSAPLHFALALGVPSLGFLSGGDVARWFSRAGERDQLLRRGVLTPLPSSLEMKWAFHGWGRRNRKHFESFSHVSGVFLAKKTLQ